MNAAVVIIGNEILKGKFADENGPFLIKRLRQLGCGLVRLSTIADELDDIAHEVRYSSQRATRVITTGGVGPTHDDLTFEGVARAFDEPLQQREELVDYLRRFDMPLTEATLRMARVPCSATFIHHPTLLFPIVQVHNVVVLPGVPKLMRIKFEAIAEGFAGPHIHTGRVYTSEHETAIAQRLFAIQDAHPDVEIGSYPRFGEAHFRVIVTLESSSADALEAARRALHEQLVVVFPETSEE